MAHHHERMRPISRSDSTRSRRTRDGTPQVTRERTTVGWLRRHAIPLTGVEAGRGFDDLEPLRSIIGTARIVALGEATHGSREFFQLKHRLLEFLVSEMGFTTFALEANWPESLAVNDFVVHGRGDPASVLAGLHFWTWDTEEVLDLIRWMRRYNADRPPWARVTFAGFDAQYTARAATRSADYITQVDPGFALDIVPRLALFEREPSDYSILAPAEVDALRATAQDLAARLRTHKRSYVARSTIVDWHLARQHATILRQVDGQRRAGDDARTRYQLRDAAMAANVAWILGQPSAEAKVVVWAHNGHVARDPRGIFDGSVVSMGMHLVRRLGPDVVVVGFAFGEGAFQAVVKEPGGRRPIREVTVGAPPVGSLDAALAQTGIPFFLLDLRGASDDSPRWLQDPQVTREIGAFFERPQDMVLTIVPRARYDVLAFVARTTRARPNPATLGPDTSRPA